MRGAHSISTRRAYGVQRVCHVWHSPAPAVYARRATRGALIDCLSRLWHCLWCPTTRNATDQPTNILVTRHHEHAPLDLREGAFTMSC